jgi:hypothetical protein
VKGTHPKRTFPFLPDLLTGAERGLLKRYDFETALAIEHS